MFEGFFSLFFPIYSCNVQYNTQPIIKAPIFILFFGGGREGGVVRDFCMGWESVFSVFGGKGTRP